MSTAEFKIVVDDLSSGAVVALLEEHLADMYATSPPESVHALDADSLKSPEITFYSGWRGEDLLGCVALKQLSKCHLELKSMRTSNKARNLGFGKKLLEHVLEVAKQKEVARISLETGSQAFFEPARNLYQKYGFEFCRPFANYEDDPNSKFMTKLL